MSECGIRHSLLEDKLSESDSFNNWWNYQIDRRENLIFDRLASKCSKIRIKWIGVGE